MNVAECSSNDDKKTSIVVLARVHAARVEAWEVTFAHLRAGVRAAGVQVNVNARAFVCVLPKLSGSR